MPTTGQNHLGIGGNTACMQLVVGDARAASCDECLIFDAGTGIRELGKQIMAQPSPPSTIHLFFTHFHWDHVQGLPFFLPIYSPAHHIVFHSDRPVEELRTILEGQMRSPYFPVLFGDLRASLEFRQIGRDPIRIGDLTVSAFPLHHPQHSSAFHIQHADRTAVYATDHEHGDPPTETMLLERAHGVDLLVYDAQYTPAEYETRKGWGHSTWLKATEVARAAQVREMVLFHHDPERTDAQVRAIEAEARNLFPNTHAAYEGLLL